MKRKQKVMKPKRLDSMIEQGLFASRWLMAPMYLGLAGSLLILLYGFMSEFVHLVLNISDITQGHL